MPVFNANSEIEEIPTSVIRENNHSPPSAMIDCAFEVDDPISPLMSLASVTLLDATIQQETVDSCSHTTRASHEDQWTLRTAISVSDFPVKKWDNHITNNEHRLIK